MTTPTGLWAEGDALTPTNLNQRNPTGTFPSSTYHVSWASGTGTTQINHAIVNAATSHYSYCFVARSSLPYDASQVSFIDGVHMTCEGGRNDCYDTRAYGVGFSLSDGQPGIQAAINAAANSLAETRTVYISNAGNGSFGNYKIPLAKPLWLKGPGTRLIADRGGFASGTGVQLYANGYVGGPTILVASASATVPGITTALATGTGNAWNSTTANGYFDIRDIPTGELNGLTAFTVECFFKPATSADMGISFAGGTLLNGDAASNAWNWTVSGGNLSCIVSLSGGQKTVNGGAITAGTSQHIAITYDGVTLRQFVNGALAASTAATGTLVQGIGEAVLVGTSGNATYDAFRISNTARYTAAFTAPTAKFANDANTLVLMNFDDQFGSLTKAYTKDGVAWLWNRRTEASTYPVLGGEIEGLVIGGSTTGISGIFVTNGSNHLRLSRLFFTTCRLGIYIPFGDSYLWSADDIEMTQVGRFGFYASGNAVLSTLRSLHITGGVVPLVLTGATTVDGGYILADSNTVFLVLTIDNANPNIPPDIRGLGLSVEVGVGANFRATVGATTAGAVHASGVILRSCNLETNNGPFILADSTDQVIADTCNFTVLGGTVTGVLGRVGPPQPAVFRRCHQNSNWIPWSVTTGDAVLTDLGTLTSASTGSTLHFDGTAYDRWDLTLTSDVTTSSWQSVAYGQPLTGVIKMDSTGSRLFVWPTNSKGTATLSYGSSAVNTFTGFYDGVNVILTSVRTGL